MAEVVAEPVPVATTEVVAWTAEVAAVVAATVELT